MNKFVSDLSVLFVLWNGMFCEEHCRKNGENCEFILPLIYVLLLAPYLQQFAREIAPRNQSVPVYCSGWRVFLLLKGKDFICRNVDQNLSFESRNCDSSAVCLLIYHAMCVIIFGQKHCGVCVCGVSVVVWSERWHRLRADETGQCLVASLRQWALVMIHTPALHCGDGHSVVRVVCIMQWLWCNCVMHCVLANVIAEAVVYKHLDTCYALISAELMSAISVIIGLQHHITSYN